MSDISFSHPYTLLLLELVPAMLLYYFRNYRKQRSVIQLSSFSGFTGYKKTFRQRLVHTPFLLRTLGISMLIIAIADPKNIHLRQLNDSQNSQLVYLIDQSAPMLDIDFKPNRMESLRASLYNFIDHHSSYPSGLAGFSSGPGIECPVTNDISNLKIKLAKMQVHTDNFSPALNESIEAALGLLMQTKSRNKFLICFTAGNNSGLPDTRSTAAMLKKQGIKLCLVAIASVGLARTVVRSQGKLVFRNSIEDLDELPFRQLSEETGGQYFRVTSSQELDGAMLHISGLIDQNKSLWTKNYEGILPFAWIAAFLLCLEIFLRYTFLKSLP